MPESFEDLSCFFPGKRTPLEEIHPKSMPFFNAKCPGKFAEKFRHFQYGLGSVRLELGGGTVPAVPVFGSGGSSIEVFFVFQSSSTETDGSGLGVLKRRVPKRLAFAFGLRLRSETRSFKTLF